MKQAAPAILVGFGTLCLLSGSYYGLFVAPPERYMGDVQRIMYIHVPTAWNALLALTWAFISALVYLVRGGRAWDARLEAGIEVGVILTALLCALGAIWARPTWGVWWDWDPRLTTSAVLLVGFVGILALRHFVDDPARRATWTAVGTVVMYIDVPIVYLSVKWWNTLHQMQSTPEIVATTFHWPLRVNAFGVLILMVGLLIARARIAEARLREELTDPEDESAGASNLVPGRVL